MSDVVADRMVDLQVEEGLPLYLVTLRPNERVLAQLREEEAMQRRTALSNP